MGETLPERVMQTGCDTSPRESQESQRSRGLVSERELRPTATYRKVTGGFRSTWGANFFAAVRSVIGTAARRGIDAYQAIKMVLQGQSALDTA